MGKALAAWLMVASAMAATDAGPRQVVETAVTRVIAALEAVQFQQPAEERGSRRHIGQLYQELKQVADELFDFDEMARRALSRHWAARSPEERAEFIRLFTRMLERAYLGRIEAYAGETIVYLGETIEPPYASVRSRVITRRSETPLDYRLHLRNGRWRVYDISIDGVSFVATYRSQFDRVIRQESYATLLESLRKRSGGLADSEPGARGL